MYSTSIRVSVRIRTSTRTPLCSSGESSTKSLEIPRDCDDTEGYIISASTERQFHAIRLKEIVEMTMIDDVEGLKPFDSCIEASDTLASTSTSSGRGLDSLTGMVDCSVLVSPDGELLIIPQQQNCKDEQERGHNTFCGDTENSYNQEGKVNDIVNEDGEQDKWWNSNVQSSELGEEYASAIFLGNDLPGQGDKAMNGFSTKGWSMAAVSLALKQSADSIADLAQFFEEHIMHRKLRTVKETQTIEKLRNIVGVQQSELKASKIAEYQQYLQDNFNAENLNQRDRNRNFRIKKFLSQKLQQEQNNILKVSPDRVGPLNYSGGTIPATLKALENYYSSLTESESVRLKAMSDETGTLTNLRNAALKTEGRVRRRQLALQETMRRIKTMENHLRSCKLDAKKKWEKVHETEMIVTRLVGEKMMQRNKLREEEREKQTKEDERKQANRHKGEAGASTSEILDIVSAAKALMEEGSFEPVVGISNHVSSLMTNDDNPREITALGPPEEMELEMDARYEFEVQFGLPELRIMAFAAERAVDDASTSLLSVLSNWDTTSRSAQLAAETCLVSSGNALASSIRSIISAERESMDERLNLLEKLENVANQIDVRADVNRYINIDKAKEGGRSYRGEYDDGGVASALNYLHSDPGSWTDSESDKNFSVSDDETEGNATDCSLVSPEYIEERLECFFKFDPLLRNDGSKLEGFEKAKEEFEENVEKLCTIGEGRSSKYTARRSTICYAMNTKRSTNAEIPSLVQFDGLCRVFTAVLSGCNTNDDGGVSNAVLLMGISQHFHVEEAGKKIYVKSRLVGHSLWENDTFWDRALQQMIADKLNHTCVLSNFERVSHKTMTAEGKEKSEWTQTHKTRWHDLTELERYQAASQVNAIVFAEVSAMVGSMLELCGRQDKTGAFVRRVCVKNQLPMYQRISLLRNIAGGFPP